MKPPVTHRRVDRDEWVNRLGLSCFVGPIRIQLDYCPSGYSAYIHDPRVDNKIINIIL